MLDQRTASKIVFIVGDVNPGGENDATLCRLIGHNWKTITGVGEGVCFKSASGNKTAPGFHTDAYWSQMVAVDANRA